jgi:hypothetical protein
MALIWIAMCLVLLVAVASAIAVGGGDAVERPQKTNLGPVHVRWSHVAYVAVPVLVLMSIVVRSGGPWWWAVVVLAVGVAVGVGQYFYLGRLQP